RDDISLYIFSENVDACLLILTAIEDMNRLSDAFSNGIFLRAMRMKNVGIEVRPTGFQVDILCGDLLNLSVGSFHADRFSLAGAHRPQELSVSGFILPYDVTPHEVEPDIKKKLTVFVDNSAC